MVELRLRQHIFHIDQGREDSWCRRFLPAFVSDFEVIVVFVFVCIYVWSSVSRSVRYILNLSQNWVIFGWFSFLSKMLFCHLFPDFYECTSKQVPVHLIIRYFNIMQAGALFCKTQMCEVQLKINAFKTLFLLKQTEFKCNPGGVLDYI